MKKIISLFILTLILNSCSSKKHIYNVYNNIFKNETDYKFYGKKVDIIPNYNDTILLSEETILTKELSNFSLNFEEYKSTKILNNGSYRVFWADSINKITLTQTDIAFTRNQMNKEIFYFDNKKINNKNRIVINLDSVYNSKNIYSFESSKKEYLIYHFSKPCFNKKKNICIIGFYTNSNTRKCCGSKMILLLLKKTNNKWDVLGFEENVGSSH